MATVDDDLLFGEDLDNIGNDNEGDDDVHESSSDNEEMKKIFYELVKKEAGELTGRTNR